MPETASAVAAPTRLADALATAAETLARAGIGGARREATLLWTAVADVSPGHAWLARDQLVAPDLFDRFRHAVAERARRVPVAYATGRAAFRTLTLAVDPRALIPRPETEGLVEVVLQRTAGAPGGVAADVGTGTGCIALSLAVEGRFTKVIATDHAEPTAALARENVDRVRPVTPVEVRVGHLVEPLVGERYSAIVANPPYLTEGEWALLDPAVRDFEPRQALVSGPDGLDATRALLHGARPLLAPDGVLALEIDERRAEAVIALARAAGWPSVTVRRDLCGRPRYVVAVLGEDT